MGWSGDQSHDNYFDTSHIVEYTSGTPYDIYSKLEQIYLFQLLIQWTAATDMTGATDATRPVYNMGSQSNLVGLANNQTFEKVEAAGALPTSVCFIGFL